MIRVHNKLTGCNVLLGLVRTENIDIHTMPDGFEKKLDDLLTARKNPLSDEEETLRGEVRQMLRNGRYRPTGRGKPASEYLVRSAQRENGADFPRINAAVDICNFISLKYLLPISIWDLDLAESSEYVFRLGREKEAYIFNTGGQTIELEDLVVGCRKTASGSVEGEPIVNPVKDSLQTKTTVDTRRVAASIYAPPVVTQERLMSICAEFASLLGECGKEIRQSFDVVLPGEECTV